MKESTAECIANCLRIQKGTHVLYRSFGLNVIDSTNVPIPKDVLVQISTYYPEVNLNNVTTKRTDINGHFEYLVEVGE